MLTLGKYPQMPMCLMSRLVPLSETTLSTRERHCVLHRMSQVITHRLAACAHTLPQHMHITVQNAVVSCITICPLTCLFS